MKKKKTGRPSRVENSPFRRDIDEMLREGKSADVISAYLKSNGESISRSAIYRYKNDHFNIQSEAVKKYNNRKSKERLDEASNDLVDDLVIIDKQLLEVSGKINIDKMTENQRANYLTNLLNVKYKILGHDGSNLEVNVHNDLSTLFDDELVEEVLNEQETNETDN